MKANNPEYTMGDIAKELGRRWASADPETKGKYEALSEQDKARYDRVSALGDVALTSVFVQDTRSIQHSVQICTSFLVL